MSRSIHTSRPKFRKAFRQDYSTSEERTWVLGKIIDEIGLKRAVKANARVKKQCERVGVPYTQIYLEHHEAASKKAQPTPDAKEMVKRHNQKGYG